MTAITTAAPGGSALAEASGYSSKRRKTALLVVALAFVMDLMDATILTIALPAIRRTMHASNTAVHWMAAAYAPTFALLLITSGRLGDVLGYKNLFLAGVAGFLVSSLLVTTAIVLLVFPLSQGRELGWPAWTYAMMAASVPVFGVFAWWQRRQAAAGGSPLLAPTLFAHRPFTLGLVISLLVFAT